MHCIIDIQVLSLLEDIYRNVNHISNVKTNSIYMCLEANETKSFINKSSLV